MGGEGGGARARVGAMCSGVEVRLRIARIIFFIRQLLYQNIMDHLSERLTADGLTGRRSIPGATVKKNTDEIGQLGQDRTWSATTQ